MIPVKVECGCGQRYAFEIEPVDGHMPTSVKCPACGADGTAAANAFIAQLAPAPAAVPAKAPPIRVRLTASPLSPTEATSAVTLAAAPPAPAPSSYRREIDRDRIITEARAKVFWGDPTDQVTIFMMSQGFDHPEASALVAGMYRERLANLRGIGLRRVFVGGGMICVPIVAFFVYRHLGYLPIKLFAIKVGVGLWGLVMFTRGAIQLLAPRLGSEDLADQNDD
jgi:hypothetical protein